MGKQYIFRPSSTTPQEVLDFLEEETRKTSFPKLLVSLVEKEISHRNGSPSLASPADKPTVKEDAPAAIGFDFSPVNDAELGAQNARLFEKLDEIEQKIDKVANIGFKVENKVGSVDGHLFSSMKVIDAAMKEQAGMLKKIQQSKSLSAVAVEKSVFASMPERTIFSEMPDAIGTTDGNQAGEAGNTDIGGDTEELLKALLGA